MISTVRIGEGFLPMTWNNYLFRIRTLGTSIRTENTEEVPSERTVQHCYVPPLSQRMYHVAKQATYVPLANSGSCISKVGYQPPLTNIYRLT